MMIPDWQKPCINMSLRGAALLKSGKWSDCAFLVGSEPDQVEFHAHKLILAMASPVFEAMFYSGLPENIEPIRVMDIQPDTFEAMLEYIYADKIEIASFDKATELCYAAEKYMLPHLYQEGIKYLLDGLDSSNVCKAYEFAKLFEEVSLMDKSLQMFSSETNKLISDANFVDVEFSTVITIFSLDQLNIDSELDLFAAALQYFKAQSSAPQNECAYASAVLPSSCSEEETPVENYSDDDIMNKPIRNALKLIRFLTMTAQQFAKGPSQSGLLTDSESHAILTNILLGSDAHIPMPKEFSTSKTSRLAPGDLLEEERVICKDLWYGRDTVGTIVKKVDSSNYSIKLDGGTFVKKPIDQFIKTEILIHTECI